MIDAAVGNDGAGRGGRRVGAMLGIGIFVLPWIFAWFLLRKGYSRTARFVAFGWMIAVLLFAILGGGGPNRAGTATSAVSVAQTPATRPITEPGPRLSGPQINAARSAQRYLRMSGFSREGLIQQLSSSYGDGYDLADATAAVDSLDVDWNENAVRSARQYLNLSGFSCRGVIEQLSSSAGDQYTVAQATYGAEHAGACS